MRRHIYLAVFAVALCATASATTVHDVAVVNGHPGYLTAMEVSSDGIVDKVIMLIHGFDIENDSHPTDFLNSNYQHVIDTLGPLGWDVALFDYVRGDIDINQNAENLTHYIQYLDTIATPGYHLALAANSMGGIVCRTMFVAQNSDMGVDTFVTIDSPHHGVTLSNYCNGLATLGLNPYVAAHQMLKSDSQFDTLYGWLRSTENNGVFQPAIIAPMATCAIALSNGEGEWRVDWSNIALHNEYWPVASRVTVVEDTIITTFMPYGSVVRLDRTSLHNSIRWGYTKFYYNDTSTAFFDQKIANGVYEHGFPYHTRVQAVDFIAAHCP